MTERPIYNKENMLLKPKVIDGINCNQWKSMIHTFLQKVFVAGTFRYTDAVVYYTCTTKKVADKKQKKQKKQKK